jgi:hypothetical protein
MTGHPEPSADDRRRLGGFLLEELAADLISRDLDYLNAAGPALGALAVSAQRLALGIVVDDRKAVRGALRATV